MLRKIKLLVSHVLCVFVPKSYVDSINGAGDRSELDKEFLKISGFSDKEN